MSTGRIALAIYAVFLAGYAFWKFGDPSAGSGFPAAAFLVLTTAVAPYLASLAAARTMSRRPFAAIALALVAGLFVCVGGYAAHWWWFLAPEGGAPAVYDVAPRGIGWGLLQGALAAIVFRRT